MLQLVVCLGYGSMHVRDCTVRILQINLNCKTYVGKAAVTSCCEDEHVRTWISQGHALGDLFVDHLIIQVSVAQTRCVYNLRHENWIHLETLKEMHT